MVQHSTQRGRTERHRHESSVISGAFYLDLPEGDFGKFFFVSALQPYMMCVHNVKETPYGMYFYDVYQRKTFVFFHHG